MIRVALHCDWRTDESWYECFKKYMKPDCTWDNILFVPPGEPYDFIVIFNRPMRYDFDPKKAVLVQLETYLTRDVVFLVKARQEYFYVLTREDGPMPAQWALDSSYDQLRSSSPGKTKVLSSVVSGHIDKPMHGIRLAFLESIRWEWFDLYGKRISNRPSSPRYVGQLARKEDGLKAYKYAIAIENDRLLNYFTEKATDAILCECLCFYDGCPNVYDWINPEVIVPIDMTHRAAAMETIEKTVRDKEWEKRLPAIREEKRLILEHKQPAPFIHRIVNRIERAGGHNGGRP